MASDEDLAEYALSISIPRVIQELEDRGLFVVGTPEVLRARLAQVIFQAAGSQAVSAKFVRESDDVETLASLTPLETIKSTSEKDIKDSETSCSRKLFARRDT